MIRLDFAQGSDDWKYARLGIPTASEFHRIITPSMKKSGSWDKYAQELLAEEMLDHPIDESESQFMTRGSDLERDARKYYEFVQGVTLDAAGFIVRDDGLVGCSPDSLAGDDGGLEIKAKSAAIHVGYLVGFADREFKTQVQGCLWLTGRKWWDLLLYNPELPSAIHRIERDEKFIAEIEHLVNEFIQFLAHCRQELVLGGYLSRESIEARRVKRQEMGLPC